MHISFLPLITLVSTVLAAPLAPLIQRDTSVVQHNLLRITNANAPLEAQLAKKPRAWSSFQEADNWFHQIYTLGNNVVAELHGGAEDIKYSKASITDSEARNLQRLTAPMEKSLNNVVNAIISCKRDVDYIQRRREMIDMLTRARVENDYFFDAILAKMNIVSKVVGTTVKSRFTNIFSRGIKDYGQ
jgi:hypothetical protein